MNNQKCFRTIFIPQHPLFDFEPPKKSFDEWIEIAVEKMMEPVREALSQKKSRKKAKIKDDFFDTSGIWEGRDINSKELREKAWKIK